MVLEELLVKTIPYIAAFLEGVGVLIILIASLDSIYKLIKSKLDFGNKEIKLELANAMSLSLDFKLAAEILKSVLITTIDDFLILLAIVVLRVIIGIVIQRGINDLEESL